jgi:hypothetical protein
MKIDVKLFPLGVRSVSGTDIPEDIFKEYIDSDRCKDALRRKIMLGGLTHITRDMPDDFNGKIGQDDVQLLDGNATHYIEKFWIGDDGYVYCRAVILDPEIFDDKQAANIRRLIGYLKSGVQLGVSVVVDSITDTRTGAASQLLAIIGFDFTFSPAFKDTKIVKIYEDE